MIPVFTAPWRRVRLTRPSPPFVPPKPPADLVAESEQRASAGLIRAGELNDRLAPPGLGKRYDGELPDPVVFGTAPLRIPTPWVATHSCECGVLWSGDDPGCWCCGKRAKP